MRDIFRMIGDLIAFMLLPHLHFPFQILSMAEGMRTNLSTKLQCEIMNVKVAQNYSTEVTEIQCEMKDNVAKSLKLQI